MAGCFDEMKGFGWLFFGEMRSSAVCGKENEEFFATEFGKQKWNEEGSLSADFGWRRKQSCRIFPINKTMFVSHLLACVSIE